MNRTPHELGCFLGWLYQLRLDGRNKVTLLASWRNRWSCPACRVSKFSLKVQKLLLEDALSVLIVGNPSPYIEAAKALNQPYAIFYTISGRNIFLSTPLGLPDGDVGDSYKTLFKALEVVTTELVTYSVVSDGWRYEKETMPQLICSARTESKVDAHQVLLDSGLTPTPSGGYEYGDREPEEVKGIILETMEEAEYTGQFGSNLTI